MKLHYFFKINIFVYSFTFHLVHLTLYCTLIFFVFKRYIEVVRDWANDPIRKDENKVVIMDNVSFHFNNIHLAAMAKEDNVEFVPLPKNSTYCWQPLDVAFFKTFKASWKISMQRFVQSISNIFYYGTVKILRNTVEIG